MVKVRISAVISVILGIISLAWVIYDYIAVNDIVYTFGENLTQRRYVTLGFIPIILFHFFFFLTIYFVFDFLKSQKAIIKEHKQQQSQLEQIKTKDKTEQEDLRKKTEQDQRKNI